MLELKPKLKSVLLIDDDDVTNFYNGHLIRKMNIADNISEVMNGREAIEYLLHADNMPELLFLDINMPVMNGFEFLEEYEKLSEDRKGNFLILMLTSSLSPIDKSRASQFPSLTDYYPKPLSQEKIAEILVKYFPDRVVQ